MGKCLQDRIKSIEQYRPYISYKDGLFILKIRFKKACKVVTTDDERVAYAKDDNDEHLHWFVSNIEDADLIFDIIDDTIAVNQELEKKIIFYKEKVKELQELILSDVSYEKLLTLQFTFQEPKRSKKQTKKQSQIQNETEEGTIQDTIVKGIENMPTEIINTDVKSDIDEKISKAIGG